MYMLSRKEDHTYTIRRTDSKRFNEGNYRLIFGVIDPHKYGGHMVEYSSGDSEKKPADKLDATECSFSLRSALNESDIANLAENDLVVVCSSPAQQKPATPRVKIVTATLNALIDKFAAVE